jgi:hypothetical protein
LIDERITQLIFPFLAEWLFATSDSVATRNEITGEITVKMSRKHSNSYLKQIVLAQKYKMETMEIASILEPFEFKDNEVN